MKLKIENISKNYGKKKALNGVSFEMENGIYRLLGPNGAGKSTLIRILAGVMEASDGEVMVNGKNRKACDREYRSKLGYLPQSLNFYPEFSGLDYLRFVAALKGMKGASMESNQSFADAMEGKVWLCKMTVDEVVDFQNSHIISNVLPLGDRMEVRVVSDEKPSAEALPVQPSLEDAYLYEFETVGRV